MSWAAVKPPLDESVADVMYTDMMAQTTSYQDADLVLYDSPPAWTSEAPLE